MTFGGEFRERVPARGANGRFSHGPSVKRGGGETVIHCPGCGKDLSQLTVFHAKECTAKQATLEESTDK